MVAVFNNTGIGLVTTVPIRCENPEVSIKMTHDLHSEVLVLPAIIVDNFVQGSRN